MQIWFGWIINYNGIMEWGYQIKLMGMLLLMRNKTVIINTWQKIWEMKNEKWKTNNEI